MAEASVLGREKVQELVVNIAQHCECKLMSLNCKW